MKKSEEQGDIEKTLSKIPLSHRKLVQGYDWKLQGGNTLKGDGEHIGYVDRMNKQIAVAAPWNYGREFAILHEIAHQVWEQLPKEIKKAWFHVVANTKGKKQDQNPEELFCMAYANQYVKNKIVIHDHPEWKAFIAELPQ